MKKAVVRGMKGQVGDYSLRKVSAGVAAVVKQAIAMCGIFSTKRGKKKKKKKKKKTEKVYRKGGKRAVARMLLACGWI